MYKGFLTRCAKEGQLEFVQRQQSRKQWRVAVKHENNYK